MNPRHRSPYGARNGRNPCDNSRPSDMLAAISRHADLLRTQPPGPRGVRRIEVAMPKFTDRFLSSLKVEPGRKDRLVFDNACPGLGVRVTAKGTRTFLAQWTDPATRRKVREPIGIWGAITIEQA